MIYLKRIFEIILFIILMPIVLISIALTTLLYPFYIMLHYIVYGDFGISFPTLIDKEIDIILKPLDLF
jgi:hypothetical protein